MDATQLRSYYVREADALVSALDTLTDLNWDGLIHWLKAEATYNDRELKPEFVEQVRALAEPLCELHRAYAGVPA